MIIKNHILFSDNGEQAEYVETPNKSGHLKPIYLIMHYTAGNSFNGAVSWLSNRDAKASAHFVIGRDGRIAQMVPLNRQAWHAGRSKWGELRSLNQYSIGIEMVNAGKLHQRTDGAWVNWANNVIPDDEVVMTTHKNETEETGWQNYTEEQIKASIQVASAIHKKYELTDILGHDDIAPDRKIDPGPAFPMLSFSSMVIGRH